MFRRPQHALHGRTMFFKKSVVTPFSVDSIRFRAQPHEGPGCIYQSLNSYN
jgi:hypothetical protein